jgi:hypothetical protein
MGTFDIFKRKSQAEKNIMFMQKLRKKTIIHESKSKMHSMIVSSEHENVVFLDQFPNGEGEFGIVSSNPIPVYGIDNIPAYMDKLRYKYTSISESGNITYNSIDYLRTSDEDQSKVGTKKPSTAFAASSISLPNIKGHIDCYNIYSIGGEKLAKIYINCYSLKTSNKVPIGFFHRDEVPAEKDSKVLMEAMKHMNK